MPPLAGQGLFYGTQAAAGVINVAAVRIRQRTIRRERLRPAWVRRC
jgi:hypothetical protein